jgi:tRNA A37 N6-isopentenylltransferase MiaA
LDHLENGTPLDDALEAAVQRTRALARRQWSWFRRDPRIEWLDPSRDLLEQLLVRWDEAGRAESTREQARAECGRRPAEAEHDPVGD